MKKNYNPIGIEKKWQKKWADDQIYKTSILPKNKKFYVLDMFPYISGAGIHVGHPKGYIATDVVARYKTLQGFSVLHPMGWDAFGLPAENYAIKHKINPSIFVRNHIKRFKKQLNMFGFTYDWDREINTTDPDYYKWTQFIFLKMFEKGLAYESDEPVNWCPSCKTVLANEDLENGNCERCDTEVIQKKLRQWVLRMTKYADRLLYDLDSENLDWEDFIKDQQRNWIGRSEGVEFKLKIKDSNQNIEVYTTRIDTALGMTYAVIAPEHKLIEKFKDKISNYKEVGNYVSRAQNKTELERTELQKEKRGVELKGLKVINPFNNEELPLYVADYVLGFYGTGAVMAVPAHDQRDLVFAKKHNLPIREVIKTISSTLKNEVVVDDGILINSGEYNGLTSVQAREKMIGWLEKREIGKKKVNYKMRDWVFSRQRYWGEPIPIVHCKQCGAVGIPEKELPLKLPEVKSYEPSGTGESPLANIKNWVNTKCPKCGGPARRETNTMPQWAGSNWYYLRYIDPKNKTSIIDSKKEKEWMSVDLYVGGAEHATRHLLYARFWHKFLYDIGIVSTKEPFRKLVHVGLILAEDGKKMSKRWGNVVNPDDIINEFGVDSLRIYEMFMGPFTQSITWSTKGVVGARRFLEKVWRLQFKITRQERHNNKIEKLIHKTIKKVSEDIESFRFNTSISALMILTNKMDREKEIKLSDYQKLIVLLSPFTPHFSEELWSRIGGKESIFYQKWPRYNEYLVNSEDEMTIVIQINGKIRDQIRVSSDVKRDEIENIALKGKKIAVIIRDKSIKKIIYVEKRLVNIVI